MQNIVYVDINNLPGASETTSHEVRFICPVCLEGKIAEGRTLEQRDASINRTSLQGWCHNCNTIFRTEEYNELKSLIYKSSRRRRFKVLAAEMPSLPSHDKESYEYFVSRCPQYYNMDVAKRFDLKFIKGRVFIPFKFKGVNIYYQLRYVDKNRKPKYFMPPIDKPLFTIYSNMFKPTILVEGVFDAIALATVTDKYNIIAVLGNSFSQYQYNFINELGGLGEVLLFMDKEELSQSILKNLRKHGWKGKYKKVIVKGDTPEEDLQLNGKDPEEILDQFGKEKLLSFLDS